MKCKKHSVSGIKGLIRGLEGLTEVVALTFLYFSFWSDDYNNLHILSAFGGYGHWIIIAIYAALTMVLLSAFDGLLFGYLRMSDMLLSQSLSMLIVNFVT